MHVYTSNIKIIHFFNNRHVLYYNKKYHLNHTLSPGRPTSCKTASNERIREILSWPEAHQWHPRGGTPAAWNLVKDRLSPWFLGSRAAMSIGRLPWVPETRNWQQKHLKMDGWKTTFLLGRLIIRGELLVLGRAGFKLLGPFFPLDLKGHFFLQLLRVWCVISFWGNVLVAGTQHMLKP